MEDLFTKKKCRRLKNFFFPLKSFFFFLSLLLSYFYLFIYFANSFFWNILVSSCVLWFSFMFSLFYSNDRVFENQNTGCQIKKTTKKFFWFLWFTKNQKYNVRFLADRNKKMPIKITVMSRVKFVKLGQQKWMKEFNLPTESKKIKRILP